MRGPFNFVCCFFLYNRFDLVQGICFVFLLFPFSPATISQFKEHEEVARQSAFIVLATERNPKVAAHVPAQEFHKTKLFKEKKKTHNHHSCFDGVRNGLEMG